MKAHHVPNALTVVRILLVPVLVVALLRGTGRGDLLAACVFAIASLTDAADGYLARTRDVVSDFGKLMDPVADKLLIVAALFVLVWLDRLSTWVAVVIIGREVAVTVLRLVATRRGAIIPASPFGKIKTVFQVAMVISLIAVSGDSPDWLGWLIYATVAVTVASGADYFVGLRRHIRQARAGTPAPS